MKAYLKRIALCAALAAPLAAVAGGDGPMIEAPHEDVEINRISMREAESLIGQPNVIFYDVNTLEIWSEGYIPGAVFYNVHDWKKLLPQDKSKYTLVFYCANRLCESSVKAALAAKKLGYADVRQVPEGIYGWRVSGRRTELP